MPTWTQYRRDLALKAAMLKVVTTGVLYSGTYQGTASGADAARQIISSDLAHTNLAGTASEMPSTGADYQWVYVPSTAEQRRIVKNGFQSYAVASGVLTGQNAGADAYIVGYATIDRALAAALAPNLSVEILGRFPVLGYEDVPGLLWATNEALQVMHWPRKETVTGTGSLRIDVSSSFPWLKRPEQLIRVFDTDPGGTGEPSPMAGPSWLEPDGEKMYLHIPRAVTSGVTFSIQVRRPCSTWILVKRTARASVTVAAGAVTAVTLLDGGVGYSGTATATFGGSGSGASVTVTVANGAVTGFSGLVGGSGYVQATTTVAISAPTTTTWTTSTVGLANDEDEALPDVDRVTAVAYWQLCLRMSRRGPKPQQADWAKEAAEAAKNAAPFVMHQNEPPAPPMLRVPRRLTGRAMRPVGFGSRRWP